MLICISAKAVVHMLTPPPPLLGACVRIHCDTAEAVASVWRMLCQVPDADFVPAEVWLAGELHYLIVRTDGEQTSTRPADRQG
jgi:hypothetical protein